MISEIATLCKWEKKMWNNLIVKHLKHKKNKVIYQIKTKQKQKNINYIYLTHE